ncbi:MAG: hypothetical protein V1867_03865 [Candidatus Falkowbacteria bacterium]
MDWIESFLEWRQFGLNFETICAGVVILFTIVEAILFLRQNRIIWRNRSGRSLSVDLFLFLPFLFASLFVYGLERHEGALAINGLLFIFTIPIVIGLAKFNGLSRRHIALLFLCGCALFAMIVLPVKLFFYSLFAFANVVFLLFQLWELRRSPSVGAIDIHLVIFYGFINAAWTVYAWWFADWPLFAVTLASTVILAGIAGLYYRKKATSAGFFGDARDATFRNRLRIGFSYCYDKWKNSSVSCNGHNLKIENHPVMEDWEDNYMKDLAEIVCARGGDILEVGFGMGISAGYIQKHAISSHAVIEANKKIYDDLLSFARSASRPVKPLFGFWQEVTPTLKDGSFDGILFDTYPLTEEEVHKNHFFFFKEAYRLLRSGGILTYYSDEIDRFSPEHLKKLGEAGFRNIDSRICRVCPQKGCEYWQSDRILAPIILK